MTTAINIRTGAWEQVEIDGYGRVPAGYRPLGETDRAHGRGHELRIELARHMARGDVVAAAETRRTLAEARSAGVAI